MKYRFTSRGLLYEATVERSKLYLERVYTDTKGGRRTINPWDKQFTRIARTAWDCIHNGTAPIEAKP